MYAPQNYYCFAIDNKASESFHSKMKTLGKCFENVIISDVEFNVDQPGHNMVRSLTYCLHLLLQRPKWKYAILLQANFNFYDVWIQQCRGYVICY